jgi:hypothetical protein
VHLFGGTHNGIDWASLNTQRAAYAFLGINESDRPWAFYTTLRINGGVEIKGIVRIDRR